MTDFSKNGAEVPRTNTKEQGRILLADRISLGKTPIVDASVFPPKFDSSCMVTLPEVLSGTQVIDYSNVSNYYNENEGYKNWTLREMFGMRPPFESCWFECSNETIKESVGKVPNRSGVWVHASEVLPTSTVVEGAKFDWIAGVVPENCIVLTLLVIQFYNKLSSRIRSQFGVSEYIQFLGSAFLVIDETGKAIAGLKVPNIQGELSEEKSELYVDAIACEVFPVLFSIQFMNCKNVKTVRNEPSKTLEDSYMKRHKRPMLRYYTIEIEPMKKVLENEGGIKGNGIKKALHLCRGHFAHYTPDKPLFGRVTGTVWKPAHVRGNPSEGIIAKDYSLKAPKV